MVQNKKKRELRIHLLDSATDQNNGSCLISLFKFRDIPDCPAAFSSHVR